MKLFSTKDFAKLLGISQRTVERRIAAGLIPAQKEGRGLKIPTLTTKEVADKLGVSPATVRKRIAAGTLEGTKTGRGFLVPTKPGPSAQDIKYAPEPVLPAPGKGELGYGPEPSDMYFGPGGIIKLRAGVHTADEYEHKEHRKVKQTVEEAIEYARPIPVPTEVIRLPTGEYQVFVTGSA